MEGRAVGHNFERNPPGTIPARLGLIWFSGFREDLNVKVYDVWRTDGRMPSDGKKKCLWKINSNNKIWIWSIAWTWRKTPLKSIETTIDFVLFSTKCTFGIWFGFFDTWINIYILSVKCHATKWSDRVSEWFLFNANFSAISWQEHS